MAGTLDRQNYDNTYMLALREKDPIAFLDKRWGNPVPYFEDHIKPHIKPDSTVVDIGAGFGRYTRLAIPICKKVYAIEASDMCLSFLEKTFPDITTLPSGDFSFKDIDVAFSMSTMLHFNIEEIFSYMDNLSTRTKKGGVFILHYMDLNEGLKKQSLSQLQANKRYCYHTFATLFIIGHDTGFLLAKKEIPKNPIVHGHAIAVFKCGY